MSWQDQISNQAKISKQGKSLLDTNLDWVEAKVKNPNQLSKVLQIANQNSCFVLTETQAKLGSSVCQWINQTQTDKAKFVFLDLSDQNKVVEHVHEDQVISVRTGISIKQLNEYLKESNQWLPCHGRHLESTILNLVESGDSGPLCTGYGPAKNLVLGLESCLSDGKNIKTGGKIVKNVTGYDLTKLFVGSNSWLGISHTAHLRLFAKPESSKSLVIQITKTDLIPNIVQTLCQSGYPLSCLEVIDASLFFAWLELGNNNNHLQYQDLQKRFKRPNSINTDQSAFMIISSHGYEEELKPAFISFTSSFNNSNSSNNMELLQTASTNWLIEEVSKLSESLNYSTFNTNIPFTQGLNIAKKLKLNFPNLSWLARPVHGAFTLLIDKSDKDNEKLIESELIDLITKSDLPPHLDSAISISNQGSYSQSNFVEYKSENQSKLKLLKNSIKSQFDKNQILNPLVTF